MAIQDQGSIPATRPIAVPWEAWALLAAALAAVAVGTYTRGVVGPDWFFTTDNLAHSAPLGIPFLIAAGVVVGAGRWPAAHPWLGMGAALLATSGALAVTAEVAFAAMAADGGVVDATGWLNAIGTLRGAAAVTAFAALAMGLWQCAEGTWTTARTVAGICAAIVTLAAAAGPIVTPALSGVSLPPDAFLPTMLGIATTSGTIVAIGALAIAAVRAAPARTPLPEVLIAAGAIVRAAVLGSMYWVLWTLVEDSGAAFSIVSVTGPLGDVASLVLAAGFASGALFWPAEPRSAG